MKDLQSICDRQKFAQSNISYSTQRMDLLIISVSGAGVYLSMMTLQYILDKNYPASPIYLKVIAGIFLIAIIANFISQWASGKANTHDYLMCEYLRANNGQPSADEQAKADDHDTLAESFSKKVKFWNASSMYLMFIGLAALAVFFITF